MLVEKNKNMTDFVLEQNSTNAKIDTFSRFFLTSFYTDEKNSEIYKKNISKYLKKSINLDKWKTQGRTLKSVHFYGIN
ncbi:hypothetical protein, partial [Acinetobacter baumannii]|uniref:hypothetical protein n=1 Tax=Acinetobacter baumannii TaxID=470 RepID=UPI003F65A18D|nr:hypothetical protein [Acinetobacter baumannii]